MFSMKEAIDIMYQAIKERKRMGHCPASEIELCVNAMKLVLSRLEYDIKKEL